jgi:hypothetical protein
VGFDGSVEVERMEVVGRDCLRNVLFDDFVVARDGRESNPLGILVNLSLRRRVLDVPIVVQIGVEVQWCWLVFLEFPSLSLG